MQLPPPIKEELQKYPHIPDSNTKHDARYDPNTYISIQAKVNNDPEFEIEYFKKLIYDGWVMLKDVNDIYLYPSGRQFKYRLNGKGLSQVESGTFRSGGWLLQKNYNSENKNENFILYKGYNGAIFSLQIKDLSEVYILSPKKEISIFKKPLVKTNFPVYLENPKTEKLEIVYYGKDQYQKNRFQNSLKYKKAIATGKWDWATSFID